MIDAIVAERFVLRRPASPSTLAPTVPSSPVLDSEPCTSARASKPLDPSPGVNRSRIADVHVHLDPVGGVAGDMFAAALLDAFPERAEALAAGLAKTRLHEIVTIRSEPFTDGVLQGCRFHAAPAPADGRGRVPGHTRHRASAEEAEPEPSRDGDPNPGHGHAHERGPHDAPGARTRSRDPGDGEGDAGPRHGPSDPARPGRHAHDHGHDHDHGHGNGNGHGHHHHRRFADIRAWLRESGLAGPVAERATAIFTVLAEAEAEVHGIAVEDVTFHEVGAWDSIADVVCAAWLIDSLEPADWSCSPLPLGGGQVRTAHGMLPVPAPATALLLRGFPSRHDGVGGERVTPTGAAILRHLAPAFELAGLEGRIARTGHGFGSRRLPGMSNVLRALVLDPVHAPGAWRDESIGICSFEVDDQTAEDLAVALDRLRAADGVLDVIQAPAFGKKGRMVASVRVLARPAVRERLIERCFAETATLGVRWQAVRRAALEREEAVADVAGEPVRIKRTQRAGGEVTVKAEMDDVASANGGRAGREERRRRAEST